MESPGSKWVMVLGIGVSAALAASAILTIFFGGPVPTAFLIAAAWIASVLTLLFLSSKWRRVVSELDRADGQSKEAQRAQADRARAAIQAVIDALPHGVAIISPAGVIEQVNARANLFDLAPAKKIDEIPHRWFKSLIDQAAKLRQPVGPEPAGDPAGKSASLIQIFLDGRELFFMPQAVPFFDGAKNIAGAAVVLVDVTAARYVDESKASMISTFSHELKTPLTSIQMSIYLLLDDAAPRLTPRQLELLATAREDAERLQRTVEEMLTTARSKW